MSDGHLKYSVGFFAKNPGAAYDPAPLPEFSYEAHETPTLPVPGDTISAWSRIGSGEGRTHYYRVVDRTFRHDIDEIRVFVLVEEMGDHWTSKFN